jgi:class 3 adenylate cyclase
VHVHWPVAKPNVEFLGRALTTSLEELERSVQRERPDLSSTLAADGTVTIVFTDIVDSTVMLSRLGDQAWLDVLRKHNAVIAAATTGDGGTVVEDPRRWLDACVLERAAGSQMRDRDSA